MSLLDDVKVMLNQYASGAAPSGDAGAHFQQVAQSVDAGTLAQGIAAAMMIALRQIAERNQRV